MATNFPTSLDSLTNPTSSDSLNSPSHSAQHANVNDAVEALQAKVGADSSAVTTSLDYKVAQLEAISHGKILQVLSVTKTNTFTSSTVGYVDIPDLSIDITPASTSSKILVFSQVSVGSPSLTSFALDIKRGTTQLAYIVFGRHFGTGLDSIVLSTLDAPATTSTTTYKNQISTGAGSVNVNVGSNAVYIGTSSITVMEVAG